MGVLWNKQSHISKSINLNNQKVWLNERNSCGFDIECLKASYELRLKSENFPFSLNNFKIVELFYSSNHLTTI